MKILYLAILAAILYSFQIYFELEYFAVTIPFMIGWYGSMVWDVIFKTLTEEEAKERGYHLERIRLHDKNLVAWTKDFKLGDTVYYLGHDGVGGWWHGNKTKVNEELMQKKHNLQYQIPYKTI